jgi:hypothetical protein
MKDKDVFWHIRNITAVLSLVNVAIVYAQRTVGGAKSFAEIASDPTLRLRLWVSAGLLGALGLITLGYLISANKNLLGDFIQGSGRNKILALFIGSGELVCAIAISSWLLVAG